MDFTIAYTAEQEAFRKEVRAWLDENVSDDMRIPAAPEERNQDMRSFWRTKHQELGAKGWLFPTYPKEYGGGGLSGDHETILDEEFSRAGAPRQYSNVYAFGSLYS